MVGMNAVLCAINLWFIVQLVRDRHDEAAFEVLEVRGDDEYLRHVLRVHGADILRFNPEFVHDPSDARPGRVPRPAGRRDRRRRPAARRRRHRPRPARLRHAALPRLLPRRVRLAQERHARRPWLPPRGHLASHGVPYYDRVGFHRDGDSWVLELAHDHHADPSRAARRGRRDPSRRPGPRAGPTPVGRRRLLPSPDGT